MFNGSFRGSTCSSYPQAGLSQCSLSKSTQQDEWNECNLWVYSGILNGLLHQIYHLLEPLMQFFQPNNNVDNRKETWIITLRLNSKSVLYTISAFLSSYARYAKSPSLSSVLLQSLCPTARSRDVRKNVRWLQQGLLVTVRVGMRSAQMERRAKVSSSKQWPPSGKYLIRKSAK